MTDQQPANPIDAAVGRVLARQVDLVEVTLIATARMLRMAESGALRFNQPENDDNPRLFVLQSDGQAWQAVGMTPGTWEIRKAPNDKLPDVAPQLWTPPS